MIDIIEKIYLATVLKKPVLVCLLMTGVMFIYIAGIIGWSGREYVRAVRGKKNAAEYEIIIDTDLAWQCLKRGAAWPLQANREGKNGELREKDNNVTLNGPRG